MHEAPTIWGLRRVDVRFLTPTSGDAVFRFKFVTLKSQDNNCTITPMFTLINITKISTEKVLGHGFKLQSTTNCSLISRICLHKKS